MRLTDDQARVVQHDGDLLVKAPPGSGKTTVALLKAKRAADKLGPYQKVLFLTFSNAAVDAITGRRAELLSPATRSRVEISNFHRFALEILRNYGGAVGLGSPIKIADGAVNRYIRLGAIPHPRTAGFLSFNEFVPLANEVMDRNASLRDVIASLYPVVIVDEFQDTNGDQWELVKRVSRQGNLVCLADPDQMIYEFQGASSTRFDDFRQWRPHASEIEFDPERNAHRYETGKILEVARCLRRGVALPGWIRKPDAPVHIARWFNKGQCKSELARFAHRAFDHGGQHVAILCRDNETARNVSRWLADPKVGGKWARPIAHYYHVPESDQHGLFAALRATAWAAEASRLGNAAMLGNALQWLAVVPLSLGTGKFREQDQNSLWKAGAAVLLGDTTPWKLLNSAWDSMQRAMASSSDDGRWTHEVFAALGMVRTFARYYREMMDRLGGEMERLLVRLGLNVECSRTRPVAKVADELATRVQAERSHGQPQRLTVMTIHQAKGREYDAVAVLYSAYRRAGGPDEESRVLYTAVARARQRVLLLVQQRPKTAGGAQLGDTVSRR